MRLTLMLVALLAVTIITTHGQTPTAPAPVFPKRPVTGYVTDCRVVRVIDGDTIVVEIKQSFHVRLLQCWAPEARTKDLVEKAKGLASKEHLQSLIEQEDQATLFVPLSTDLTAATSVGRVLGHVWRKSDEVTISQAQVDAGFAVAVDPRGR